MRIPLRGAHGYDVGSGRVLPMHPTQPALYDDVPLFNLARDMSQGEPSAVDGLAHVWRVSALMQGQLALIHFFRTAE
jgi:hypothetical protein